jgi:hypothetical protein
MYMRAEPAREHSERARPGVTGRFALQKIAVLDTSVTSVNLGDQIIMAAARAVLGELFPGAFFVTLPTHEFLLWESYRVLRDCDYVFVCGSNLLKSRMLWRNQWKISPLDFLMRRNCLLLGCGWWHYQRPPDFYSRCMLRRILSGSHRHSVRDEYSRRQLQAAGIDAVLNTACVSMWSLTAQHCAAIPHERAPRVVTTVTGYAADAPRDRAFIQLLLKHYSEVLLWPQQPEDVGYYESLDAPGVRLVAPNLAAFSEFLRNNHADYVGTRLHGGIRALQLGKRALILAVDNRAIEIGADTHLPVVARQDTAAIERWIETPAPTRIALPTEAIAAWRTQFAAGRE